MLLTGGRALSSPNQGFHGRQREEKTSKHRKNCKIRTVPTAQSPTHGKKTDILPAGSHGSVATHTTTIYEISSFTAPNHPLIVTRGDYASPFGK